jgi:hypothetical protein
MVFRKSNIPYNSKNETYNFGSSGICVKIKVFKVKFTKILTIKKNKVIKFWRLLNVS